MQLTCPHCQFSKEIPAAKLPPEATRVNCPQCKESFSLPAYSPETTNQQSITCPVCDLDQPAAAACTSCGLIFAKYRSAQQKELITPPENNPASLAEKPKAGFWLRLVARMVDDFLISLMLLSFIILVSLTGSINLFTHSSTANLVLLFALCVWAFYWIFFTGYCGQTPGKMLLRIQVVTVDGAPLGYGKAFYREVVGKFISSIILGIGYLMAAFDEQKQGLHDRMAKTYVIKL